MEDNEQQIQGNSNVQVGSNSGNIIHIDKVVKKTKIVILNSHFDEIERLVEKLAADKVEIRKGKGF